MVDIVRKQRMIPNINMKPHKDYLVFEEIPRGETAGGLVVPDDAADMGPPKGFVIAVGPGRRTDSNPDKYIPCDAKPGMIVYLMGTATKFYLDGKEYGLIRDTNVVAEAPNG